VVLLKGWITQLIVAVTGPRHRRQRGRARGQMQKISAGKFHFEPPFTSFDHLVGARERRRRHAEAKRLCSFEVDY
jgi:hypothetical protein